MAAAARGATLLVVLMALAHPQAALPGCTRLHGDRGAERAPRHADVATRLSMRGGTGEGGGGAGEPGGGGAVSLCRARRRRGTGKNPSRWAPPRV